MSAALLVSIFVSDLLPIFVVAGIGFLLARFFDVSVKTVSRVTFYALAPCMVFNILATSAIPALQFGRMALFFVLNTACVGAIAWLAAKAMKLDRASLVGFVLVVMFSNAGNYGMPVTLFAFGRDALTYASVYFVTSAIFTYTVGVMIAASGRRTLRHAFEGVVRVPVIYGIAAAALIRLLELPVPVGIMRPVSLLSDAALPMMMLVLGMQLERATRPDRPLVVGTAVGLSLLLSPVIAFGVSAAVGLTGPARQAAILQASMPAAVVTTILALEFDAAPNFVTSVVFISTALSPFTLTALIAYLQRASL